MTLRLAVLASRRVSISASSGSVNERPISWAWRWARRAAGNRSIRVAAGANGTSTGSSVVSLTNKATCGFQNRTFTYQSPSLVVERSSAAAVTPPTRSSTFFVPRTTSTSAVSRAPWNGRGNPAVGDAAVRPYPPLFADKPIVRVVASRYLSAVMGSGSSTTAPWSHSGWMRLARYETQPLSAGLGVVRRALELDRHHGLVADHPRVMPGPDAVHLARSDVAFGAVAVADVNTSRDAVADMLDLARVGVGNGLDALRPPPTRLERVPAHLSTGDVQQLDFGLVRCTSLVGRAEVPMLQCCHPRPPSWTSCHTVVTGSTRRLGGSTSAANLSWWIRPALPDHNTASSSGTGARSTGVGLSSHLGDQADRVDREAVSASPGGPPAAGLVTPSHATPPVSGTTSCR